MRLRDENWPKNSLLRGLAACSALALLAACNSFADSVPAASATGPRTTGPQADFPILVGPPYEVNAVTYTPVDVLNYDEVGQAILDAGATGVTGSHHTLPFPSYVEVTSLESGRTILVRLERRGPMMSNDLLALSPDAFAQLEAGSGLAVRVRRVNPPEEHRAMLRAGQMAPLRMETPASLVTILRRRLPAEAVAVAPVEAAAPVAKREALPVETPPASAASIRKPEPRPAPRANTAQSPASSPAPAAAPATLGEGFFVQAAAFSTQERADRAASALDAHVVPGGKLFRVRTGPFANREEAAASLAKVRAAGYDDARILTGG